MVAGGKTERLRQIKKELREHGIISKETAGGVREEAFVEGKTFTAGHLYPEKTVLDDGSGTTKAWMGEKSPAIKEVPAETSKTNAGDPSPRDWLAPIDLDDVVLELLALQRLQCETVKILLEIKDSLSAMRVLADKNAFDASDFKNSIDALAAAIAHDRRREERSRR